MGTDRSVGVSCDYARFTLSGTGDRLAARPPKGLAEGTDIVDSPAIRSPSTLNAYT